jgi:hypothetical protein
MGGIGKYGGKKGKILSFFGERVEIGYLGEGTIKCTRKR